MKITDVKIYPQKIPLIETFRIAFAEVSEAYTIIVELTTDEGVSGFGEAVPTTRITGESFNQAIENLKYLRKYLIGKDPLYIGSLEYEVNKVLLGNPSIKAAINMALYDILGKTSGKPVYKLLGGFRDSFETDITIGIKSVEDTVKDALKHVKAGFKVLKIKVGLNDEEDIEKIRRIRDVIGYNIRIRLDANQAWSPKRAVKIMKKLERYEIEMLEQPVPYWDIEGLKYVKERIEAPVIADESAHNSRDVISLVKREAVDGVNIKLMKCGGLTKAVEILEYARKKNIKCMLGSMIEGPYSINYALHLAMAYSDVIKYIDLDSPLLYKEPSSELEFKFRGCEIVYNP